MNDILFETRSSGFDKKQVLLYLEELINLHEGIEHTLELEIKDNKVLIQSLQKTNVEIVEKHNELVKNYNLLLKKSRDLAKEIEEIKSGASLKQMDNIILSPTGTLSGRYSE